MKRRDLLLSAGILGVGLPAFAKTTEKDASSNGYAFSEFVSYKTPEMFGAKGDGIFDDSDAIDLAAGWLISSSFNKLVFNSGKKYRLTRTINFDFGKDIIGCCIEMQGPIVPDNNIGNCFVINRAIGGVFYLNVIGNGVDVNDEIPDYTLAEPDNAQQAFVINSSRSSRITCIGYGYKGRVLRTMSTGDIKTSFLEINLWTGDSNIISKNGICGQAAYLEGGKDAFGIVTNAYTNWDTYGSVLYNLTDLTIGHWEFGAGTHNPALSIIGCQTVHAVVLSGGVIGEKYPVIRIEPSEEQICIGINIQRLFVTCGSNNIEVMGKGKSDVTHKPLTINSLYSFKSKLSAIFLEDVSNIEINNAYIDDTNIGIKFSGTCCNIRIDGYIKNPREYGFLSTAKSDIKAIFFTGRILSSAETMAYIDFYNSKTSHVIFKDCYFDGKSVIFCLNESNDIEICSSYIEGKAIFSRARARSITTTSGLITKNKGKATMPIGDKTMIVDHGLISVPSFINIIPTSSFNPFLIENVTEKSFTLRIDSSQGNDSFTFMWQAECECL